MLKTYYNLTKPGIIYGNVLTASGGFLLAAKGHVDFWLLVATLVGMSLVIAAACVFNNYIDRGIDKKMARTKQRALVSGLVSGRAAMLYATLLGLVGFTTLAVGTNLITLTVGLIAFIVYVVLYGLSKRRSVHGTLVGSIAGAAPVVAGYTAVTSRFDPGALILFLILAVWQMPHFYAIAMYRFNDYQAAGLPVWPVKKGLKSTKIQITVYVVAFIMATASLTILGYAGYSFLVVMTLFGLAWLRQGLKGWQTTDDKKWARKMFFFSLIVITTLSVMLSLDSLLP